MLTKVKLSNLVLTNCVRTSNRSHGLLNSKNVNKLVNSLNYSTDYSKLKAVDLSFFKFDSKNSSRSPVFIYHGLFGKSTFVIKKNII